MTVIKSLHLVRCIPRTRIAASLAELMSQKPGGRHRTPDWHGPKVEHGLQVFECYLHVTSQRFAPSGYITQVELDLLIHFVATLKSGQLVRLDNSRDTYKYLMPLFSALHRAFGHPALASIATNASRALDAPTAQSAIELAALSRKVHFDPEAVDMWAGWPVKSQSGRESAMDLYSLHTCLGSEFARAYCQAVNEEFYTARAIYTRNIYGRFAEYLADNLEPGGSQRLKSSHFTQGLLLNFMRSYFVERHAEGMTIKYLKSSWRCFVRFLEDHVFPAGLIAAPEIPLPTPIVGASVGAKTRIRKSLEPGRREDVKANLITEVPLSLTDLEAAEFIFKQLECDLGIIRSWALSAREDVLRLQKRRQELASFYLSKKQLGKNNALARTAYQYEQFVETGNSKKRVPGYCREHAGSLGIINGLSLLPFAILIIIEHPQITTTFLNDLELYDKNGKMTGLVHLDRSSYLTGYKMRRGAANAEQRIKLNSVSLGLVNEILSLTSPLRRIAHLNRGTHGGRLFLVHRSKTARSLPVAVSFASVASYNAAEIALDIARRTGVDPARAKRLAKLLSLRSIRATMAVLHLRDTGSLEQTAEAIGHKDALPKLMDHYIPESLHGFLKSRWIRIFQTGIIVEAMQGSPLLFEASGLADLQQLDAFLKNHALNLADAETPVDACTPEDEREALVCISPEVVRVLSDIENRVNADKAGSPGILISWAAFYKHLKSVVLGMTDRPDLAAIIRRHEQELGRD